MRDCEKYEDKLKAHYILPTLRFPLRNNRAIVEFVKSKRDALGYLDGYDNHKYNVDVWK